MPTGIVSHSEKEKGRSVGSVGGGKIFRGSSGG